jgi:hypothetical protein
MKTLIKYVYSGFSKKCKRIKRSLDITSASCDSLGSHKREYKDRTMDATNIIIGVKLFSIPELTLLVKVKALNRFIG